MGASDSGQKKSYLFAFIILPLLIISNITGSYAASYVINPINTNISFGIERFKRSTTTGGFYNVKGNLQYDPSSQTGDISLVIPISSLNTGNKAFNHTLTGPNFFDVKRFPLARFDSTKWYFNQNKSLPKILKVDGDLTKLSDPKKLETFTTSLTVICTPHLKKMFAMVILRLPLTEPNGISINMHGFESLKTSTWRFKLRPLNSSYYR